MADTFTYVKADDWVGIYKNGVLVEEGHRIPIDNLFEILGVKFDIIHADQEWLEEFGNLPDKIEDVKKEE
jgi:hypothetical protein